MTQKEEKQLLMKDLCARLPYGTKINVNGEEDILLELGVDTGCVNASYDIEDVKPYLRPMSSMPEEEIVELKWLNEKCDVMPTFEYVPVENYRIYDWMNRHHFDFRNLIEKGLALEAPADMYNIEKE